MRLEFSLQVFEKILKLLENPSVGVELFHADGRTDRYDEANIRFLKICGRA
jgi:hypothetical protein